MAEDTDTVLVLCNRNKYRNNTHEGINRSQGTKDNKKGRKEMKNTKAFAIVFGLIFMLAGLIAGIAGTAVFTSEKKSQEKCTETAIGTLTHYEEELVSVSKRSKSGKTTHSMENRFVPVFEFTANGNTYTAEDTALAAKDQPYEAGSTIEVHYDPDSPRENYIVPLQKFAIILPAVFGTVFTIVGLIVMIAGIKGKVRVR